MNKEQKPQNQEQESEGVIAFLRGWWEKTFVKAGLTLFAFIVLVLGGLWRFASPDVAKFSAYLIGGGLLFLQIIASSRRATAAEETAKAMHKTAELTEKGNIDERFKNAVEHFGNNSNATRLGGIYALHNIAREDSKYQKQVFEILCAYIRGTTARENYPAKNKMQPSVVISSILNLLFIGPDCEIYQELHANLKGSNLRGAQLQQANLKGANLIGANLQYADLQGAMLAEAKLDKANLRNAKLNAIKSDGDFVKGMRINDPRLNNARINDKNFAGADLQRATLYDANLQGADLEGAEHLDIELLLAAKTLYETKLPDEMKENIRQRKPKLLEKPADEPAK